MTGQIMTSQIMTRTLRPVHKTLQGNEILHTHNNNLQLLINFKFIHFNSRSTIRKR